MKPSDDTGRRARRSRGAAAGAARGRAAAAAAGPRAVRVPKGLEQLRALAHPLRMRLFEQFSLGPLTTMQAAARLGQPPTRLYHHVATLERAGLLRLTETRPNRGTIEKYYAAAQPRGTRPGGGRRMTVTRRASLTREGMREETALGALLLEQTREDFHSAIGRMGPGADPARLPLLARFTLAVSPERLVRVRREMMRLLGRIRSLERKAGPAADRQVWSLTLALAPAAPAAVPAPPPRPAPGRGPVRAQPAARRTSGGEAARAKPRGRGTRRG